MFFMQLALIILSLIGLVSTGIQARRFLSLFCFCVVHLSLFGLFSTLNGFLITHRFMQLIQQECLKIPDPQPIFQEKSLPGALQQLLRSKDNAQFKDVMKQYLTRQAELQFLTSQINPHFLYNTLDSIRSLALINNDLDTARMAESLGMMFRCVLKDSGKLVTLRSELNILDKYLFIQTIRFKNRFTVIKSYDEDSPELDNHLVPSLILQPIVENAIVHGLKNTQSGGRIVIAIRYSDTRIIIKISDNGQGMTPQQVELCNEYFTASKPIDLVTNAQKQRIGIGLLNINSRIRKEFGDNYGIVLRSILHKGTEVEITLPKNPKELYEA